MSNRASSNATIFQKECACDTTLVVPREKIEDKPKPAAKHEQNDEAKKKPPQRRETIARRNTGDETLTGIAHSYNVSHSIISRL